MTIEDSEQIEEEIELPESGDTEELEIEEDLPDDIDVDQEEEPEAVDDSEEIEFNQQSYKLPKTIAEAVKSMQKDYTQKTMAVAEQRKDLEARIKFQESFAEESSELRAIDRQLEQFNKVDWNHVIETDMQLSQKLMAQRDELNRQRQSLANSVAQKYQQYTLTEQQDLAKAIQESETVLRREIKDWNSDKEAKLQEFAVKQFGFDIEDVKKSKSDPRLYKLLHAAYIGNQVLTKQTVKQKPVDAKPVPKVTGKSAKANGIPDPDKDWNGYMKWRRQGYK